MRFYLLLSLVFHLVVALLCLVGLPSFLQREIKTDYVMIAEVVTTADLTNVLIKAAQAPKKPIETQKPQKSIREEIIEEKKGEEHKAEIIEKDPHRMAENIALKKKEEKPQPKPAKKKAEQKAKKAETKKPSKKKDDSFEKMIIASLEEANKKKEEKPDKKDKKIEKDFLKEMENALTGETNKEFNSNLPITMSEVDAIRNQISRNWNTTAFAGSADAKGMKVTIRIELDIEGNVVDKKPIKQNNSSPYYKVFVESALRAIEISNPLQNLSKEKFVSWKEIEFDFDASGMIY